MLGAELVGAICGLRTFCARPSLVFGEACGPPTTLTTTLAPAHINVVTYNWEDEGD